VFRSLSLLSQCNTAAAVSSARSRAMLASAAEGGGGAGARGRSRAAQPRPRGRQDRRRSAAPAAAAAAAVPSRPRRGRSAPPKMPHRPPTPHPNPNDDPDYHGSGSDEEGEQEQRDERDDDDYSKAQPREHKKLRGLLRKNVDTHGDQRAAGLLDLAAFVLPDVPQVLVLSMIKHRRTRFRLWNFVLLRVFSSTNKGMVQKFECFFFFFFFFFAHHHPLTKNSYFFQKKRLKKIHFVIPEATRGSQEYIPKSVLSLSGSKLAVEKLKSASKAHRQLAGVYVGVNCNMPGLVHVAAGVSGTGTGKGPRTRGSGSDSGSGSGTGSGSGGTGTGSGSGSGTGTGIALWVIVMDFGTFIWRFLGFWGVFGLVNVKKWLEIGVFFSKLPFSYQKHPF
jgi:hypothetical protein